jgi:hypothetical protein
MARCAVTGIKDQLPSACIAALVKARCLSFPERWVRFGQDPAEAGAGDQKAAKQKKQKARLDHGMTISHIAMTTLRRCGYTVAAAANVW